MNSTTLVTGKTSLRIPREVAALLAALQLSVSDTTSLEKLSDEEWRSLLAFCNIAHLTLPLAQLSMKGFPSWVVEQLTTNLADYTLRFERVKATYREAAKALDEAGVEHIVIKGFTQSPDYVADPRFRSQSDIDFYCCPENIDAATRAMQAIRYRPSDAEISYALADHGVTLVRPGEWQWRGNPFDPEMPLGVELHFCLWNETVSRIRVPEAGFWAERHTTREVDGLSFPCLCPVDHLAYLALHILRNLFLGDWIIHHVRELAVFLHNHADDEAFWQLWNQTHSPSLRSLQAIAFYYARTWFDCRLHPLAACEIYQLPPAPRSWLQRFAGSALRVMFDENKDSVWLQLIFLTSPREKWKILTRTLIPPRIASIGVPPKVRNKRALQVSDRSPLKQYIAYLISRSAAHGQLILATLVRGFLWRLSLHAKRKSLGTVRNPEPLLTLFQLTKVSVPSGSQTEL
jgi:hypothetical protein